MTKLTKVWSRLFTRQLSSLTRQSVRAGNRAIGKALKPTLEQHLPPPGAGDWLQGMAVGPSGVRHFRLYRPPGVKTGERLPLIVMLHGCSQTAKSFAVSTRMNQLAARQRFLVLYPEQDRLANAQACWNWFDTSSGRAYGEAALIMKAVDQVCLLYPADRERVAVAGLSAGASMAALLVTSYPERFKAVVMHSGIPPGAAHSGISALGAMHGRPSARHAPIIPKMIAAARPPLLVIHGGRDHVVAASNGHAAALAWAEASGARAGSGRQVQRGKRYAMLITDYKCRGDTVATEVDIERLGHAWSGGAANMPFSDQDGPDASRMVWAFASRQFRLNRRAVK